MKTAISMRARAARHALLVLGLSAAVLPAWACREAKDGPRAARPRPTQHGAEPSSRRNTVADLARQHDDAATQQLVALYGIWSDEPAAAAARRDILDALFALEDVSARVKAVLDAVVADITPPETDPLWRHAVDGMAMTWLEQDAGLAAARDQMLLEDRPRARRLLATALARAAPELAKRLSDDQRQAVAADLIDIYFEPDSEPFQAELQLGIAALAGKDVGMLLALGVERVGPDRFGLVVENDRAVQQALKTAADTAKKRVVDED